MKQTQENRILQALQENPSGLHPTFFIMDLKIFQYNGRINGLRTRFGCNHKSKDAVCFATEHIINKRLHDGTTLFIYKKDIIDKNKEFTDYIAQKKQERKEQQDREKLQLDLF